MPQITRTFLLTAITFIFARLAFSQTNPIENAGKPMSPLEKHIHQVCKDVVDNNKTTDHLTEQDLADLPIGIARQIGNGIYVIAIDSAYWNGKGWYFSAYASITFPGTTKPVAFRARDIEFNKGGLASLSATQLVLASPQYITISDDVVLELPADGGNFIEFDCNGFKSVNLKGNFIFTGNLLVPDNTQTPAEYVTASFEINTTDLNNVMVSTTITPFKINGLADVAFEVKNAVADFSDYNNPHGFSFPVDYHQPFGENPSLWRGFFLQDLTVSIHGLSGGGEPLTLAGRNIILDDLGVSGTLAATNLLSLDNGSADGWPFSVDGISIRLLNNSLVQGTMNGNIVIPFLGEDPVAYTADLEQVQEQINYKFAIATTGDKEFATALSAKIKLDAGSTLSLERRDGTLIPAALLHGSISIVNSKMEASGIKFQNLLVTSQEPYIMNGEFSTVSSGQPKSVGFPVRIDSVKLQLAEGQVALGFGIALNFMDADAKGFSAKTYIHVFAKQEVTLSSNASGSISQQNWRFNGIKISDIALNCNTTAFTLNGRLTVFDDDPEFGNGFRGSLGFSIKKVLERGIQVNAYFGSKDAFRYWHFDAYVPTVAIPLVPPLAINGIIGGASYKMARKQTFTPDFTQLNTAEQPSESSNTSRNSSAEFAFVPDASAGLSFMAGVTLIAGNEKAFNSDAVFEVAFNASGGLRYAQFKGTGYFFTAMESRGRATGSQRVPAPVFADLNMIYDQDNNVFHTNLKTYMNLEGTVRGMGPNNMIGEAVIHADPRDWHIYIGRPTQMLGVDIANLAVAQGYFMAGTQIEQTPPPPPELQRIMNTRDVSLVKDETAMALARGFALGLRFETGYDSKDKIKPFYAAFSIGAGADVMIRDFGDATCSGSTRTIGFDGWYASGQAYVFMKGKVGIKVKGKKFDFLSLGAAALLQAKLPNPTWLKGTLAGNYSVLGGLVSGKFNVKIIVGEECEIVTPGSELGDILVIADLKPDANSSDVSVFTSPQVTFNTAINSELSMLNNQDELTTYRVVLDEFSILHNGQPVAAAQEWNTRKDALALRSHEILPPQTLLKAFAKIHWEKKRSNGTWQPLQENGQTDYETKEVQFTTGAAPDFIPEENVLYSYPVKNQYNFMMNEHRQGYLKLRVGQAYLFERLATDTVTWTYFARFEDRTGRQTETLIRYEKSQATVHLDIPATLQKETVYNYTFIKKPETSGEVDKNVNREKIIREAAEGNEVAVTSNTLKGTIIQNIEKEIYASAFRTSRFSTFDEKFATITNMRDLFNITPGNIALIGKGLSLPETFDDVELNGTPNRHKALLQLTASPENRWMQSHIAPTLYNDYPTHPSVSITRRNTDSLGVKPLKALTISNLQENYSLSESDRTSGLTLSKSGDVRLMYYLSDVAFGDYRELLNKAAARAVAGGSVPAAVTRLLSSTGYTDLIPGSTYPIEIGYTLPGINRVTSRKQIVIQF